MDISNNSSVDPNNAPQKTWSRFAVALGILSCLASPLSWYFGLSLAVAVVAMFFALIGFLRGERSRAAWFWPVLAMILGSLVYSVYLHLTGPVDQAQAQQVLQSNFADDFESDFAHLVGDAGRKAAINEDGGVQAAW